jgi:hypothetical protein
VTVNGQAVHFDAIGPVQVSGRVLVPLRNVLDRAGAKVRWSPDSKILYARRGGMTLELPLGQPTAKVNGRSVRMEVPAMMMRGTIMVPLRFVTESLGATDAGTRLSRSPSRASQARVGGSTSTAMAAASGSELANVASTVASVIASEEAASEDAAAARRSGRPNANSTPTAHTCMAAEPANPNNQPVGRRLRI